MLSDALTLDQVADPEPHRLGGMRIAAARGGDRRGKEVFQLEEPARRRDVLVGGDPADGAFMHADRVRDVAQDQRPQRLDTVAEKALLLLHYLGGNLQDRRRRAGAAPLMSQFAACMRSVRYSRSILFKAVRLMLA